jgi:hypothetical protein
VQEAKDIVKMDDSIKTLRNYSIVGYAKTRISKMGTIANGKYLLFDLKLWHAKGYRLQSVCF